MGKIYSINCSAAKGVPKEPARTAVLVKGLGIEGDAHAGTDARTRGCAGA